MSGFKDCYACDRETDLVVLRRLPVREDIAHDEHWRVVHATGSALPGWLVLVPRRHVTTIAELTDDEAQALGSWQVRVSRALHAVTGCEKTYVAQFAEAEGYSHLHFHIVPRDADLAAELKGPKIFGLLGAAAAASGAKAVTEAQADTIAGKVRAALEA
ncbi:MAG TPA: HIT family protein [Actinocrinis sp.]|nr:HIT family protein [Actinocrinis sp.]